MAKSVNKRSKPAGKAPRGVPDDEWKLAVALQEAQGRGLRFHAGHFFEVKEAGFPWILYSTNAFPVSNQEVVGCCAFGALKLAGYTKLDSVGNAPTGNDLNPDGKWSWNEYDNGESFGYAYRCAMTQKA